MAHLTEIVQSDEDVYELAPHAEGFWTGVMGYCALVIFFWDQGGSRYGSGRGQHCSGGLGAMQLDKLTAGLAGRQDVQIVLVLGTSNDLMSVDKRKLSELQEIARTNNWPIAQFEAVPAESVVTRTVQYMRRSDYDKGGQAAQPSVTKARCCVVM